jgi:hypothetical protein
MSDPFESNDPAPEPAPAEPPASRPADPAVIPPGSRQPVPASQSAPSPAGNGRGSWHYTSVPTRARVACRSTDLPPPVMHYDACGRGSSAGVALARKLPGCLGPTYYDAGPAVTPGPRTPS